MNCREALNLLYDVIDKEASDIDVKKVRSHLQKCHDCFRIYRLEESVQALITERLSNDNSSVQLNDLRSRILVKLDDADEVDEDLCDKKVNKSFRVPTAILVAVASIVILVGASYVGRGLYIHNSYFIPVQRAHSTWLSSSTYFEDETVTSLLLASAVESYGYDVSRTVSAFQLVGGRPENILGVGMYHLMYVNDDRFVSVFLAPADEMVIPENLNGKCVNRHNLELFDNQCLDCRLCYHRIGDLFVITATTEKSVELLDFIPGHSLPRSI